MFLTYFLYLFHVFSFGCILIYSVNSSTPQLCTAQQRNNRGDMVEKPYSKVSIELNKGYDYSELKEVLKEDGSTQIQIIINNNNEKLVFDLEKGRKFDLNTFNFFKNKDYVKKISF